MTEHLSSLFGTAVGMLPTAPARSLELFTEITSADETACDAWVGRLRCGDTDRATLFRAWYSRNNFGQLAGTAEISMNSVNARIPIGGLYGDITYPVNSPLAYYWSRKGLPLTEIPYAQIRRIYVVLADGQRVEDVITEGYPLKLSEPQLVAKIGGAVIYQMMR